MSGGRRFDLIAGGFFLAASITAALNAEWLIGGGLGVFSLSCIARGLDRQQ